MLYHVVSRLALVAISYVVFQALIMPEINSAMEALQHVNSAIGH